MFGVHRHHWSIYTQGLGMLPKQNVPRAEALIPGRVERCDCGKLEFCPDDPNLNRVEIDPKSISIVSRETM